MLKISAFKQGILLDRKKFTDRVKSYHTFFVVAKTDFFDGRSSERFKTIFNIKKTCHVGLDFISAKFQLLILI